MTHDPTQELLEAYVDETLDRATRAEVDRHLAECGQCRAILEGVPAVRLDALERTGFDERAMRRAVRTTLLRLAANVVAVGLLVWLVVTLIGFLVIQPLVVNRGGRAAAATQATQDLAVMYNPGAALGDTTHESGILRRESDASVVFPIGTEAIELGTLRSRIGPLSFRSVDGAPLFPFLADSGGGNAAEQLAAVGTGTVATVEMGFDPAISVEQAQALADSPIDVRVVWAGFATADGNATGAGLEPGGVVGYSTCDPREVDTDFLAASGGGSSRSPFPQPPSIARALDATRASIENLLDHDELIEGISGLTRNGVVEAGSYLSAKPAVSTLVVTGPTPELLRFLEEAAPAAAGVRGIEFTNWYQPLCGR